MEVAPLLVLTRKAGQAIVISDNIRVTVLGVEGDKVSIGIDAPKEIKVFRSELLDETRNINRMSAGSISNVIGAIKSENE